VETEGRSAANQKGHRGNAKDTGNAVNAVRAASAVRLVGTTVNCCSADCEGYARGQLRQSGGRPPASWDTGGRHTGGRHTGRHTGEGGTPGHGNAGTGTSTGAGRLGLLHLQSMLLATDTVGMGAMLRKGVFECHANKWDTIVHR
jgi:hypothetical protein